MKRLRILLIGYAIALASLSASAAVLQISSGKLTGATGVNVGGSLINGSWVGGTFYDVTFRAGSCIQWFSGCDEASDFLMTSGTAIQAAGALRDQVFQNVSEGNFDTNPALTAGCDGTCSVITPYELVAPMYDFLPWRVNTIVFTNWNDEIFFEDFVGLGISGRDAVASNAVWAIWRMSSVPEPAPLMLLALGAAWMAIGKRLSAGRTVCEV